jgi:hypothetical protein
MMGLTSGTTSLTVGKTSMITGNSGKDHVVGTAFFSDGSQQVIYDNSI